MSNVEIPTPITRKDMYYAKIGGAEIKDLPTPVTREDMFLYALCIGEGDKPTPLSRTEMYLSHIVNNGGMGGGGLKFDGVLVTRNILVGAYVAPIMEV